MKDSKSCISMNLKLKTCIEGSMKSIGACGKLVKHAINTSMDKTSCTSSDYGFTGQIR